MPTNDKDVFDEEAYRQRISNLSARNENNAFDEEAQRQRIIGLSVRKDPLLDSLKRQRDLSIDIMMKNNPPPKPWQIKQATKQADNKLSWYLTYRNRIDVAEETRNNMLKSLAQEPEARILQREFCAQANIIEGRLLTELAKFDSSPADIKKAIVKADTEMKQAYIKIFETPEAIAITQNHPVDFRKEDFARQRVQILGVAPVISASQQTVNQAKSQQKPLKPQRTKPNNSEARLAEIKQIESAVAQTVEQVSALQQAARTTAKSPKEQIKANACATSKPTKSEGLTDMSSNTENRESKNQLFSSKDDKLILEKIGATIGKCTQLLLAQAAGSLIDGAIAGAKYLGILAVKATIVAGRTLVAAGKSAHEAYQNRNSTTDRPSNPLASAAENFPGVDNESGLTPGFDIKPGGMK